MSFDFPFYILNGKLLTDRPLLDRGMKLLDSWKNKHSTNHAILGGVDMETVRAEGERRGRTKTNRSARIPTLGNRRTRIFPDSHILFTFSSFLGNRL